MSVQQAQLAATRFVVTLQEVIRAAVTLDIFWVAMGKPVKVNSISSLYLYFMRYIFQMWTSA